MLPLCTSGGSKHVLHTSMDAIAIVLVILLLCLFLGKSLAVYTRTLLCVFSTPQIVLCILTFSWLDDLFNKYTSTDESAKHVQSEQ